MPQNKLIILLVVIAILGWVLAGVLSWVLIWQEKGPKESLFCNELETNLEKCDGKLVKIASQRSKEISQHLVGSRYPFFLDHPNYPDNPPSQIVVESNTEVICPGDMIEVVGQFHFIQIPCASGEEREAKCPYSGFSIYPLYSWKCQ